MNRPYDDFARRYLAAGWSPLPLPPRRKKQPPTGWTGQGRPMASAADVEAWCEDRPDANIALRLPPGVIGIDADAHKGEAETAAWQKLTGELGPLPDAPWCSSRDDGMSGIRLFTVPTGYVAADMGPAGEVIQHHHRYVVAPPSISPPPPVGSGQPYRWVGTDNGYVPNVDELPSLPAAWLNRLQVHQFQQPAQRQPTSWTSPNVGLLVTGGIPDGQQQEPRLRDLVFECVRLGMSEDAAHAVWLAAAARTPVKRPGDPWTDADFARHYRGAVRKAPAPAAEDGGDELGRRLILTRASEIEIEPVVWAWEDDQQGRIPSGSLGLFAGREGTGKSSFLIWLTARITTGTLPGMLWGKPRAVIYVAVEDSWKHTIAPRLVAAGADLERVYRAEVQIVEGEAVSLSLPADNKLLEEAIIGEGVAMVALDPLMSAISDTLDTHVNRQVRRALDPLARLADRTGAIIAGIAHFNKSSGTDASSLITASGAFKDVARFIFAFATDQEDGSQVITQTKNSLGLSNLPSLAYRIIDATVPTPMGDARVGRLVLDGPTERTVQDILSAQATGGEPGEKTRAEEYLREALADGPKRSKAIEEEAREAHGISLRTLKRARAEARIPAAKHGSEWWISLPEHEGDLRSPEGKTASPAKSAKGANGAGGELLEPLALFPSFNPAQSAPSTR